MTPTPDEIWCEVCRDVHSQGGPHVGELPPQTTGDETIVQFTIRPALNEERWRALHDAARVAGAVAGHINPPAYVPPQTEAETLISRLREMADRYVGGSQSYELLYLLREAAEALTTALCERDEAIQQAGKTVEFYRDMAERFAEDRDTQKHLAREYKARAEAAERLNDSTEADRVKYWKRKAISAEAQVQRQQDQITMLREAMAEDSDE